MQPMSKMTPLKGAGLASQFIGSNYEDLGVIGSGSYGDVFKVRHKVTKEIFAVKQYKKIFSSRVLALRTLREIMILRRLKNDKIIKLVDIIPPQNLDDYNSLGVILEYLPFDLKRLCEKNRFLQDHHIPKIVYQILVVLKYLKTAKILHRDLKPENILSDDNFNIKICDFGLARPGLAEPTFSELTQNELTHQKLQAQMPQKASKFLTCHVVSRWYRAPELILMQTKYDESIDMWSVGCILGELISQHERNKKMPARTRRALFEGKACFPLSPPKEQYAKLYKLQNGFPYSEDDQISKIFQVIGSPTQEQVSFIEQDLAINYVRSLPKYPKKRASQIFGYCLKEWSDFLQLALVFDPRKRMTIDQALMHQMFDSIRNPADYSFPPHVDMDLVLPSTLTLEEIKAKLKEEILQYKNTTTMVEEH